LESRMSTLEEYKKSRGKSSLIYAIYERVESGCEYFHLEDVGGYFIARCDVLDRELGKHEVPLCVSEWKTCPLRRIGLTLGVSPGARTSRRSASK
jgi:hypothetical protein